LAQIFWKLDDHPRLWSRDWPSSMSRANVMAQKPRCTQNSKTAEKAWVSHWRHFARQKLPHAIDRELLAALEKG